jgi:tetratricopeptide (TPR) repeat protein
MEPMLRGIAQQISARGLKTDKALDKYTESLGSEPPRFAPTTDAERAQALCYQAFNARGRRQLQLARQALSLDPDCCDAYVLIGDRALDPEAAVAHFQRAVEAGERQLGPDRFNEDAGHFWGIIETRPYMRARARLANALMTLERFDEAGGHLTDMLRLNPGDNQGMRYELAVCLFHAGRLDRLDDLLNRSDYRSEVSAEWLFPRALLEFRVNGDSAAAKKHLNAAKRENPFFIPLLTGQNRLPPHVPSSFSPRSREEAFILLDRMADAWINTPGALSWAKSLAAPKSNRTKQRNAKKRKRR